MVEEYQSIIKNDEWEIVPRPKDKSVVFQKWIYKTKHSTYGSIENYKERFVDNGLSHKETFAPVARYTSIRTILSLASNMKWKLQQMDVKKTFLNGLIEEHIYIEQPQGFKTNDQKTYVCRFNKEFHGLKKAPKAWYGRIDGFLMGLGFTKSKQDSNL